MTAKRILSWKWLENVFFKSDFIFDCIEETSRRFGSQTANPFELWRLIVQNECFDFSTDNFRLSEYERLFETIDLNKSALPFYARRTCETNNQATAMIINTFKLFLSRASAIEYAANSLLS